MSEYDKRGKIIAPEKESELSSRRAPRVNREAEATAQKRLHFRDGMHPGPRSSKLDDPAPGVIPMLGRLVPNGGEESVARIHNFYDPKYRAAHERLKAAKAA